MSNKAFEAQRRAAKRHHFDDVKLDANNKRYDFDVGFASGWYAHQAEMSKPQGETCKATPKHPMWAMVHDEVVSKKFPYTEGLVLAAHCSTCREIDAALLKVLDIRADNAQFGLPKWVKDEVNRLRKR